MNTLPFAWLFGSSFEGQKPQKVHVALPSLSILEHLSFDAVSHVIGHLSPVALLNVAQVCAEFREHARFFLRRTEVTELLLEVVPEESALRVYITTKDGKCEYIDFPGKKQKVSLEQYRMALSFILKFPAMVNSSNLRIIFNAEEEALPMGIERLALPSLRTNVEVQELRWPANGPIDFFNQILARETDLYVPFDGKEDSEEVLMQTIYKNHVLPRI